MARTLQAAPTQATAPAPGQARPLDGSGGSVAGAASSVQAPPKRNVAQKVAGFFLDPVAQAGQDLITKPLARGIVSTVEAFQSPEKKAQTEANFQRANSEPIPNPSILGGQTKPQKDITLESTAGDVAQSAALVVPSAKAAGALFVGGGALSDNKGPVSVAAHTALGAIGGKYLEALAKYGAAKLGPLLEKGLQKYGMPLYEKIAAGLPDEAKAAYKAMAQKASAALEKLPKGGKISDTIVKTADKFSDAFDKGFKAIETKVTKPAEKKAVEALQATEDIMTKSERKAAIKSGKVDSTTMGGKKYDPGDAVRRAAGILKDKLTGNPVKNIPVIRDTIADLGAKAEKYLDRYAKPVTIDELRSTFQPLMDKAQKTMTSSEFNAFQEQVDLFMRQMPEGKMDTGDLYRALKGWESDVASRLPKGKEALMDPNGSAKQQALSNIRGFVRDFIGDKHPAFKPKMFDLSSLYQVLDNVTSKAEKQTGNVVTRALDSKFAKRTAAAAGAVGLGVGGYEGLKAITK